MALAAGLPASAGELADEARSVRCAMRGSCGAQAQAPTNIIIMHTMAGKSGASAPADRAEFDSFPGIPSAGIAKPPLQGYAPRMFAITEADTDAILAAFDRDGEAAAVVELRRRFPGLSENAGLEATRMIVRWRPARDESAKPDR